MPRLLSAARKTLHVQLPCPRPRIIGDAEVRMPPPRASLVFGEPFEATIPAVTLLLEQWGRQGVVEMQDSEHPTESDADAFLRAKQKRYDFLRGFLNHFRNHNALLRAQGLPVLIPNDQHRDALREMKMLQKDLIDPELTDGGDPDGAVSDIAGRELEAFGIPRDAAPLTPGVEPGFTGIDL